jgi:YbgC/YbaW family acyl-CoA thioester hydrolase
MMFVASQIAIDFVKPARLDDTVAVGVEVESLGRARIVFHQEIRRDDDTLVRARVTVACVGIEGLKPMEIPEEMRKKLEAAT